MDYKPQGYTSVAPYLIVDGARATIDFLVRVRVLVLDAQPLRQHARDGGKLAHGEVRIGDTVVMLSDWVDGWPAVRSHVHVYVPDVDATYARAIAIGAEPVQKGDEDKRGGFRDPGGTTWWVATQVGGQGGASR
jgi:PhnB protein